MQLGTGGRIQQLEIDKTVGFSRRQRPQQCSPSWWGWREGWENWREGDEEGWVDVLLGACTVVLDATARASVSRAVCACRKDRIADGDVTWKWQKMRDRCHALRVTGHAVSFSETRRNLQRAIRHKRPGPVHLFPPSYSHDTCHASEEDGDGRRAKILEVFSVSDGEARDVSIANVV